ncbi:MAG: ABC transporter ATP-binding protein [Planctomycetota bacterium]|nr:ABC transporter ATP-binding protein [Planctomycetota bacterium]MDI6788468.1 ABC transporter ATP-binding protein [Planctomycetota bacterium]
MSKVSSLKLSYQLFGYARSYLGLIIITTVLIFLFTALSQGRWLLIKPLVSSFQHITGTYSLGVPTSASAPAGQTIPEVAPGYGGKLIDRFEKFIEGKTVRQTLLNIGWLGLILSILVGILHYITQYLQGLVTLKIIVDIRNRLCAHLLTLSLRFFNEKKAGDLLSRLTNDVSITGNAINFLFGDIIQQPFMILMAFVYMFILNWKLALIVLVMIPFLTVPMLFFGRRIRALRSMSLSKLGAVTESMHQMFSGIRIVKSFQMEPAEANELAKENRSFLRKSLGMVRAMALSLSIIELVGAVMVLLIAFGAVYLIKIGWLDIPLATTFLVYLLTFLRPLRVMAKSYNTLQESLGGAERIFELMEAQPDIVDEPDSIELPDFKKEIRFRNLSFIYEEGESPVRSHSPIGDGMAPKTPLLLTGRAPALSNIDFVVRAGETIAIVGPTGAGKSTVLDLLCRFYDPTEGAIEIDGFNLRKVKRTSLLRQIAIVSQEPFLFNDTIGNNIRYGRPAASLEEVKESARMAYISDFIDGLPLNYETIIGERGVKLSGGERQRLAIARAMMKNPRILLLDEATSALDSESEKIVQSAINNLMKGGITTFVIAHRISTVQNADRIIVLDKGRIVEQGGHTELLNRAGLYSKLS